MGLKEYYEESKQRVSDRFAEDFELIDVTTVPSVNDKSLTFDNVGYVLESTVLYIDIRRSTSLSDKHQKGTTGKLYSSFVEEMIRAARYHGGHVRGIVGDRVMVVYDREKNGKDCFTNAVNTAYLMNSIMSYVIKPYFRKRYNNTIECGIGIDYGSMLVTKVGTISRTEDHGNYKDLVWLGRPANQASKLTDQANKDGYKAILITEKVFDEYKRRNPNSSKDITENLWKPVQVTVGDKQIPCYTADIIWTEIQDAYNAEG
ncbi:adenylate/guanylate cyclase family protein [Alicyclobacillus sacchari]|uniref:Adenylate/guanylate cyclase family protein n=1 Tax=Alicyclobacillus sacchari TaxID=392010 RepID=A0A4R8LGS7_9BACL|nr:adenylate/guanylate cyclase domain-containing protein [Alicyclobacillus sacchari]TDY42351.1 adenylate/guanylate cyclase family protein [Alicyclobacillus sacchari]GMA58027.1 hypothetical protein GCM10025858_25300 [Alicyclobacillus sacchari]